VVWVRLADDVADHPKLLQAGPLAAWLWVCGLAYCNRHLTDGLIPAAQIRRLADVDDPALLAIRLVDAGLWEAVAGGYQVHDYGEYQPSAEDVKRERRAAAERARTYRARHGSNAGSNEGSNGVSDAVRAPSPARPGPARLTGPGPALSPTPQPPSPDEGKGERRKSRRRRGDGIRGEDVTAPPPEVVPPTAQDRVLWDLARDRLRSDMTPANFDQMVGSLDLLGRKLEGGLCLRAPPGQGIAGRVVSVVKRALYDAGDAQAASVTIVERVSSEG
jgi:hypothetical protein